MKDFKIIFTEYLQWQLEQMDKETLKEVLGYILTLLDGDERIS